VQALAAALGRGIVGDGGPAEFVLDGVQLIRNASQTGHGRLEV